MPVKCEEDKNGNKIWRNKKGRFHREDGPAIEFENGSEAWFINGKLHREGGPALIGDTGNEYWLRHGKLHRLDGPAVERISGEKSFCVKGRNLKLTEDIFEVMYKPSYDNIDEHLGDDDRTLRDIATKWFMENEPWKDNK